MVKGRVLITWSSGVFGWHLCRYFLERDYQVEGTYGRHRPELPGARFYPLSLEDAYELQQICRSCEYRAVIHTAALTHPDECEKAPARTHTVNVEGTRLLLEQLPPDTFFVYISTDLVFDGAKGSYVEEDEVMPFLYYTLFL